MQNPLKNCLPSHTWWKIKTGRSQHHQLPHQSRTKQNYTSPDSSNSRNQSLERRVSLSLKALKIFQFNRKTSQIFGVNSRSKKTLKKQLQRTHNQNWNLTRIHERRSLKNGQGRLGCQQSRQTVCQERKRSRWRTLWSGLNHTAKKQQVTSGTLGRASVSDQERIQIK